MRIKLGYPILVRHASDMCNTLLIMSEESDCLQAITHMTTDSREVMPGDMFVALKTKKDDGHLYIDEAVQRGASVILCNRDHDGVTPKCCCLYAKDTMTALASLASAYAASVPHKTIAITGSVGKTTTRRFLSSVLSTRYRVHESPQNHNNLLGVCLLLISMPRNTEILIAECGTSAPGEIAELSALLHPDYVVITNIGESHLSQFASRDAIGREKCTIIPSDKNCIVFINYDDDYLIRNAPHDSITVSTASGGADCHSVALQEDMYGISFHCKLTEHDIPHLHIPTLGEHTVLSALFAAAVGRRCGLGDEEIRHGLSLYTPERMRQTIIHFGNITLLFDAYNACPTSMKAAFNVIKTICAAKNGNMILLLGDMYELGNKTYSYHHEIGRLAAKNGVKHLFLWGNYASDYAEGAIDAGLGGDRITLFPRDAAPDSIASSVVNALSPFDSVLIKGSRGMKMERLLPPLKSRLIK